MNVVASLIVRNEANKYLVHCIRALQQFCDEIRAVDDSSTDGTHTIMQNMGVKVLRNDRSVFYEHEGRARQTLLEWTMEANPTHVVVVDGDEIVTNGMLLREAFAAPQPIPTLSERRQQRRERITRGPVTVWQLHMREVWGATEDHLLIRQDGGWKEHPVPIVFHVPPDHHSNRQLRRHWRIPDRKLACGRVPVEVAVRSNRSHPVSVTDILHFGWACESDRYERHQRYVVHDGGAHHASKHLDSIMWTDNRVRLTTIPWPDNVDKHAMLERIQRT